MRNDRIGRLGIAIVLAFTLATGIVATGTAAATPVSPTPHSVILITGDRVILTAAGNIASVEQTRPMAFSFATVAGHEYVIPLDAARLIATGRLARRLFDVSALARFGDDATLPLIVTNAQGAPVHYAPAKTALAAYWHQITGGSSFPATRIDLDAPQVAAPKARTAVTPVHTLTLHFVGPDGQPTNQFDSFLINAADGSVVSPVPDASGTATLQLPEGDYSIGNQLMVPGPHMGLPRQFFDMPYPNLKLTADTVIDVDARLAKPIAVTPPDHPAAGGVTVLYERTIAGAASLFGIGSFNTADDVLLTAHLGPPLPGLVALIDTDFGPSALDPPIVNPTGYELSWLRHNTYPTGFVRTVALSDLAKVDVDLGAASSGGGQLLPFPNLPGIGSLGIAVQHLFTGRATEYVTPNITWTFDVTSDGIDQIAEPRQFQAGHEYHQRFDAPVLGPSLPRARTPIGWISRTGDVISSHAPLFSDAPNRQGDARATTRISLSRNGTLLGEQLLDISGFDAMFTVPPDPAQYQLVYSSDRSTFGDFTTMVNVAWTFQSSHVDGPGSNLPVSVVRFTPTLDATGAAPAGRSFRVPFQVQTQQGVTQGGIQQLEIDASYDDGLTWTAVPVVGHIALLRHPTTGTFVSLRAKLTFNDGSTFDQSIIHAYRLHT